MKSLFLCFSLFASLLSPSAFAQDPASVLPGTTWEGTFEFFGMGGRIRLAFLAQANGAGALQYVSKPIFDGVPPPANLLLAFADKSCEFTPRAAALSESGGAIHVYECAPSLDEELALAADATRPAKLSIDVRRITLSEDGAQLIITAVKGPLRIKYRFQRTDASDAARTREELKAWADQLE